MSASSFISASFYFLLWILSTMYFYSALNLTYSHYPTFWRQSAFPSIYLHLSHQAKQKKNRLPSTTNTLPHMYKYKYNICEHVCLYACVCVDSLKCINIKLEIQILTQRLLLQSKDTIDDRRVWIAVHKHAYYTYIWYIHIYKYV